MEKNDRVTVLASVISYVHGGQSFQYRAGPDVAVCGSRHDEFGQDKLIGLPQYCLDCASAHVWRQRVLELLGPEHVTPLVTYLCSEACEHTHEIFDCGGGRYARIFIGLAPGWASPKGSVASPEDIRDNLPQIRDPEGYVIPDSIAEEMAALAKLMER